MSYQVLARKWRPRSFAEMVGQEHVLRALINALDNDRLHHAFLFTGTRGVGKTTIARILAKSLNCEQGVSSRPCGECAACREIDEGRFVDLIEVDAASRTKVEDTRELLDNVQYAPSRGRYKVYLVDEVHMLSNHSFNALLKTLEEPPPHVKFLLATTDPQRLPVTILSRCLQFNLKRMPLDLIRDHLGRLLEKEGIAAEPAALVEIARAADGSVRDALSLLDQAIAYGGGQVRETEVRDMLGTIDRGRVFALLQALGAGDGEALVAEISRLAEQSPDYGGVLGELISTLQRVALAQTVPGAVDDSLGDRAAVLELAGQLAPEDVQLFYQIGLIGRRDLPLAPEPRGGFEMVLLRMLAFRPAGSSSVPPMRSANESAQGSAGSAGTVPSARMESRVEEAVPQKAEPVGTLAPPARPEPFHVAEVDANEPPAAKLQGAEAERAGPGDTDWPRLVEALSLAGMARQLAVHCALERRDGERFDLVLDKAFAHLHVKKWEEALAEAVTAYLGYPARLSITVGEPAGTTPDQVKRHEARERQVQAEQSIQSDPNVKAMLEQFDGRIEPGSVRPV